MTDRRVSVIVPCYNSSRWIGRALASVEAQTLSPHEVICVDDGSTDNTVQIVHHIANRSPLSIVVIEQSNTGPAGARNAGIRAATGDVVAFLDSDDYWLPHKLATQVRFLGSTVSTTVPIVASTSDALLPNSPSTLFRRRVHHQPPGESDSARVRQVYLGRFNMFTSTLVVLTETAMRVGGFRTSLVQREDHLFLLSCMRLGRLHHVQRPLSAYWQHDDSIRHVARDPRRIWSINGAFWSEAHALFPQLGRLRRAAEAKVHRTLAGSYSASGEHRLARDHAIRAVSMRPTDWLSWAHLIKALVRL